MKSVVRLCAVGILCAAEASAAMGPGAFARERAGRDWRDGILVANGSTAALAYAPAHFEWVINRNDLYDGTVGECEYLTHAEVNRHLDTMAYPHTFGLKDRMKGDCGLRQTVSAAILRVRPWAGIGWAMPTPPRVEESLDMARGLYSAKMTSPWYPGGVRCCVPRVHDVIAVRIDDEAFPSRRYKIELAPIEDARLGAPVRFGTPEDGGFSRRLPDGRFYAAALRVEDGRELVVAVRVAASAESAVAEAREAVRDASALGFAALEKENAAWWGSFWSRGGRVSFPQHPAIERQWYFSLYALASQYGKAPMPGLNGLGYGPLDSSTPGVSSQGYTHDQNAQIPMFAFFPLNHAEFAEPFADTYLNGLDLLHGQTRARFGTDGVSLPLNMNQDCRELPAGGYRYTLCGSAYSGLVLAMAWRYSRDRSLLERKVYPLLREFAAFYLGLAKKGADGIYHFDRMVPPEIFTVTRDETSVISLLKTCLETLVEASELLGCDAELREKWRDVLAHYPVPAKLPDGAWWCGPDVKPDHRMWGGHLFYPFFPSEAYADDLEAASRTLAYAETRGMEMCYGWGKPHPNHDWSMFYQTATAIRLGDREKGWTMLGDFHEWFAKPNGLFSHNPVIVDPQVATATREQLEDRVRRTTAPWTTRSWDDSVITNALRTGGAEISADPDAKRLVAPVIEGGSAYLFLASETLLQSWGGKIRLFPSVPPDFTGAFENFRAEDGSVVSARMENGRIVSQSICARSEK